MSVSYLNRQKKGDLTELADKAGLKINRDWKKDDIVTALQEHLTKNASSLADDPAFEGYYGRASSPVKKEASSASSPNADGESKVKRRRTIKSSTDLVEDAVDIAVESTKQAIARTPRVIQRATTNLPASPSAVTELVERQSNLISQRVKHYWRASGATEYAEAVRENVSTVVGIQFLIVALEIWGLQRAVLPWRKAFTIPGTKLHAHSYPVSFPDFFVLLTANFWGPSTLWSTTSLWAPLVVAWLINPTTISSSKRARRDFDPLVFNLTKALLSWLVYSQGYTFGGLASWFTVNVVKTAIPGGSTGLLIGAGLGALISLYEAVLRK